MTERRRFTQQRCGACAPQRQKPREDAYPDVEFREVDIQADLETAEEYGVRKTPTTLAYANGEQTAEFIGIVNGDELEAAIERRPAIARTRAPTRQHHPRMTEVKRQQ